MWVLQWNKWEIRQNSSGQGRNFSTLLRIASGSFLSSKAFENKGKHGQTVQGFSTGAADNGTMECMP